MTNTKTSSRTRASVAPAEPAVARKAKAAGPVKGARAESSSKAAAKTAPNSAADSASAAAASAGKPKAKLVRDSFTIPKSEYLVLEGLKARAAKLTRPVKKSELLRAGIAVLNAMNDGAFLAALNDVPSLKTGRPKGSDAKPAPGRSAK